MDDSALQAMRILVVDEHPANVLLLERLLAIAGYSNAQSTRDPSPLAPAPRHQPPDLIALDLQMPEVSGFHVMGWLANAELPHGGPPADVFDVLSRERAYGSAWPHERTRAHISEERGRQFDPQLVDTVALDPGTFAGRADEASLGAQT